jgi:hypothetical protein
MLKTVSSITNAIGALNFKGTWDANANSPALASSVGTKGDYYVVGTAGSTNLNGISNWGVGDLATFNGSVWQRVEGGADLNGVNLSVSGTSTLSGLTASTALALNASKEVVSVANTGTGNNVLATSPTLVTPDLGTPSSVTLTNATGLPVATGISGLGTGVATALAVNVGSVGAPVVNGGALGTPSSGTVTNLTGTASININGTVGATTPAAATVTSLTSAADNNIAISGLYVRTKALTVVGQAAASSVFTIALGNFSQRVLRLAVVSKLSSGAGGSRSFYRESLIRETGGASLTENNITDIQGSNGTLAFSLSGSTITVTMFSNAGAGTNEDCEVSLEILSRTPGTITTI